jgi:TatA/E family protein of Tat protein translocase
MAVGPAEILVILLVGLLVFGPHRLPEVGRQVGAALRELRKMQDAVRGELDMVLHPDHGTDVGDDPPAEVVVEPGDHSMVDPAALDSPPPRVAAADMSPSDMSPPDMKPPDMNPPDMSPSGAPAEPEPPEDPRFSGPSGSFI